MTILYSNGCSYTANFNLLRDQRYPLILSKRLGWDCVDRAEPGSCNSRIIRTTINDCINLKKKSQDIVALVQLSHLSRFEYPTNDNPIKDPFYSVKVGDPTNTSLPNEIQKYLDSYWKIYDDYQILVNLVISLIGLTNFLSAQQIKYFLYLGPCENQIWEKNIGNEELFLFLQSQAGVIDLTKFNMLGLTGKQTHPDEQGMQVIADYFFNLLCEQV